MACNQNCDQGRICNCREDPKLWIVFVTGVWTLLTMLGILSFGMMCLGYWWYKT